MMWRLLTVLTHITLHSLQNGAERGWVLKGVDEINLLLEDMGLNLQSMMASPHVRPFAEEVRNWEQRLSLIGEAIEVCRSCLGPSWLLFEPSGLLKRPAAGDSGSAYHHHWDSQQASLLQSSFAGQHLTLCLPLGLGAFVLHGCRCGC